MSRRLPILVLAIGWLVLGATTASASSAPLTLDQLLAEFRAMSGLEAHFRETKHLALLVAPLVTDGTIYFAAPDKLARITSKPVATKMVINGSKLSFNDGETGESMSLDSNPVARLFVDSFLKIFAGDSEALARMYDAALKPGKGQHWELRLKPKIAPMSQVFDFIDLSGDGTVIQAMTVRESSGDETVTEFSAVNVQRKFTPAELSRIFATTAP